MAWAGVAGWPGTGLAAMKWSRLGPVRCSDGAPAAACCLQCDEHAPQLAHPLSSLPTAAARFPCAPLMETPACNNCATPHIRPLWHPSPDSTAVTHGIQEKHASQGAT